MFGGYGEAEGGVMFGRSDYNDLSTLNLDTFEWEQLETTGSKPEERSASQMVAHYFSLISRLLFIYHVPFPPPPP